MKRYEYSVVGYDTDTDRYDRRLGTIEAAGINKARIKTKKRLKREGFAVHKFLYIEETR